MSENVDRRVLGAIRLVDRATGQVVRRPMRVSGDGFVFIRNRSHLYVVARAPGLEVHTDTFEAPPAGPAAQTFTLSILDPAGRYLPRTVGLTLPRDAALANQGNSDSLFRPLDVVMYPAPAADLGTNWSTVRASVTRTDPQIGTVGARGALARVIRQADDQVLGSGITDERGEALVVVPGVPITNFADDDGNGDDGDDDGGDAPVVVSEVPARLEISFTAGTVWPADPEALEQGHAGALQTTIPLSLRTGREQRAAVTLA